MAIGEHLTGQQHLSGHPPRSIELGGVTLHEARLPDRRRHLERRRIVGPGGPAECGHSDSDRSGCHQDGRVAAPPCGGDALHHPAQGGPGPGRSRWAPGSMIRP